MKKLIAGNWKMNGTAAASVALAQEIVAGAGAVSTRADLLVCPPFIYIPAVRPVLKEGVALGAQDCASVEPGAYTGDIAAGMVKDSGCSYVILGHSERRQHHKETDQTVAAKAALAHKHGLVTIICVGEKENERSAGMETEVVAGQLALSLPPGASAANTVIAYEPVWAIGTGKTATPDDVRTMHGFIREKLAERLADSARMRILYGGSVKSDNAKALLSVPNVDGALVGGASLKAPEFLAIAAAA